MSHTNPRAFVQRTFTPIIGCLASPAVEQICQKNNLSFVELCRPFCSVELDQRLRDPSGNDHLVKTLQVSIQDVNERPPQPTLARKFLNESVSNASCEGTRTVDTVRGSLEVPADCSWFRTWSETFLQVQFPSDHEFVKHYLGCVLVASTLDPPETLQELLQSLQQMQATAPERLPKWFSPVIFKYYVVLHDARDGNQAEALEFFTNIKKAYGPDHCFFLKINSQGPQEGVTVPDYWSHCVLRRNNDLENSDHGSSPRTPAEVISISGMPSSLATDASAGEKTELAQEAGETVVHPVVLHPLSPEMEVNHLADKLPHVNLGVANNVVNMNVWTVNNVSSNSGLCLSSADVDSVKSFVKHLVTHALFPHVEKQIFLLADFVSTKKGMSRSILSATKRLFGSSKPSSPGTTPTNSVIYAFDAPELQLRRLGDLYFMFSNYSQAFQAYHSAKRDFGADQAWLYYAGALEMAALSSFMQGEVTKKALEYMEEAIQTYLNSCKMPQFATRATLLGTECIREVQLHSEAAQQLIRMTSEDSDLRSALLLEQASYCFLNSAKPRMSRKYAFHMVLAGHRFSKAGQKRHALRCYKQAFQVYKGLGWHLAEDHIHFTIGRLAGNLKILAEGADSLARLLTSGSKQTPQQQVSYLREYLLMHQQASVEDPKRGLSTLPLPVLEDNSSRVLVSFSSTAAPGELLSRAFHPDSPADSVRWGRMEELAVTEAQGSPMIFKPTINLFSKQSLNFVSPIVVVNEPLTVQVTVRNPLQVGLPLHELRLLWRYTSVDGRVIVNEEPTTVSESIMQTGVLEAVLIEPAATQQIILSLVPLCPGELVVLGVYYKLTCPTPPDSATAASPPTVAGKQLFTVRGPKTKPAKDQPAAEPVYLDDKRLHIKVVEAAPLLKAEAGELKTDLLCGELERMTLHLSNSGNGPLRSLYMVTSTPQMVSLDAESVLSEKVYTDPPLDTSSPHQEGVSYQVMRIALDRSGVLAPGQHVSLGMWLRAADRRGPTVLDILFYYENGIANATPRHRVCRFHRHMTIHHSVQLTGTASRSAICDTELMNISLTVKNFSQSYSALLTQLSPVRIALAGSRWKARDKALYSNDLVLESQESAFLLLQAERASVDDANVSDVKLSSGNTEHDERLPLQDFYKWHLMKKNTQESGLQLVLCLIWQATVTDSTNATFVVTGQSHLRLEQLGTTVTVPPDLPAPGVPRHPVEPVRIFGIEKKRPHSAAALVQTLHLDNAITCGLVYEHQVVHSFATCRICRVNMKLVLRNCIDQPLRVMINSLGVRPVRPVPRTQLFTPYSSSTFHWTSLCHVTIVLQGLASDSIQLSAAFTAPGTYDLGSRLSVSAAPMDDKADFVAQSCRLDTAVIISDS